MEWLSVKEADHIIICEPERIKQIPYNIEGRYSVLQNIPSFSTTDFLYDDKDYHFDNNLFTLVYVGGFTNDRCLAELIDGAAKGFYNLNIAGYGTKNVLAQLESLRDCPNIRYYGKVEYTLGLRIMYNSDIIYAMYSKQNPNHLYAAPNKYYEAMFVGKPIITTNGIITADKVQKNGIGYGIDETLEDLEKLIQNLTRKDVAQKAEKVSALWGEYKNVTEQYLTNKYAALWTSNYPSS
jgi:glycosyltransferase involved in cell wall biosynthesis